jgi:hypothetical protein
MDIYTQTDWITNDTLIPTNFRYPVIMSVLILRGFYAFNNEQSNFNANISYKSISFMSG